ncbi:hypothetical protein BTUL_0004g00680 [Botrytis tulipae]|uniref:Methyltransferase domain-containing protein n=1 Tax=Botrytis tulipae TaxID=87230 RepID=A0A4Z1F980_9HELO|nr:hypothetical protein BTUL_0004g00680 [Botrytis tulipae]
MGSTVRESTCYDSTYLAEYYDIWTGTRNDTSYNSNALVQMVSKAPSSHILVLDACTGTGRLIQAITSYAKNQSDVSLANVEFIGLDNEPHMIARAEKINSKLPVQSGCRGITWLLGSALEMSSIPVFQRKKVDLLTIGFGSISHFYQPGQPEKFLKEVAHILTPGTGIAHISIVSKLIADPELGLDKDITDPLPPSEHSSVEFPGVVYREKVVENGVQGNTWRVVRDIEVWKDETLIEKNLDTALFRVWTEKELRELVSGAGLRVLEIIPQEVDTLFVVGF